jgi:hypothetical protein
VRNRAGLRLKLLTDEHLPDEIAGAVRREMPDFDIQSIYETDRAGILAPPLLEMLDLQERTLLTPDVNSIPDFSKSDCGKGNARRGNLCQRRIPPK